MSCQQPQPGGMAMPDFEDIPAVLAQYTAAQIEEIPELKYLRGVVLSVWNSGMFGNDPAPLASRRIERRT